MDSSERLEHLKKMKSEDPTDPFPWYCFCLETTKIKAPSCDRDWEEMLSLFPDYLPSYYQAGLCFEGKGRKKEAILIWENGIRLATQKADRHALSELKSVLQNALLEDDED
jgi:tetratricopeptide (TPR) repeat protein